MRFSIVFILLALLLAACQEVDVPLTKGNSPDKFYDLKGFFEKEKEFLKTVKTIEKTVTINNASEEKVINELNFDNELSIFLAADINRPAWSDKYKIDSVFTSHKQLAQINYQTLDESLKTKKIKIDFDNNTVTNIEIIKALDNPVAQSKQTLNYRVGKGYAIQSEQALSFSETKTILIEVKY